MIHLIRGLFILTAAILGGHTAKLAEETATGGAAPSMMTGVLIGAAVALLFVALEWFLTHRHASLIPTLILGTAAGFLLTSILTEPLRKIGPIGTIDADTRMLEPFLLFLLIFFCTTAIWRTRNEFKVNLPYVRFRPERGGIPPLVLDTSAIIDGRIADLLDTGALSGPIVISRLVLQELQGIADSSDKLKRNRGRRGLDILERIQKSPGSDVRIDETERPRGEAVDGLLLDLARALEGRLVTTDLNLNKLARLQQVPVVNVNDIANAVRPAYLPGEPIRLKVIREGESAGQGVGYLADGTMVVVESGRSAVGREVDAVVTSALQTSAGRMIFAKLNGN